MALTSEHIQGVLPPMITPFLENGDVDYAGFARNIERWNAKRLSGYLVLGSNSETAYLTEEEKCELIRLTVQTAAKGRLLLAGTGLESTRETIAFTNKAASFGVQAALVLTPCYYGSQMTDEALITHFEKVADAADIPILIYNVPKFTHVNISQPALKKLSGHPNIIGMKDSAGDVAQLAATMKNAAAGFRVVVGNAAIWLPALSTGIHAGILALSNCAPDECAEIKTLVERGEKDKALDQYFRLLPVNQAITTTYGIAGLKHVCSLLGYDGGFVRGPLQPLNEEAKRKIGQILVDAKLM